MGDVRQTPEVSDKRLYQVQKGQGVSGSQVIRRLWKLGGRVQGAGEERTG